MTHEYDNKSEKSRAVAAILCVFGVFGAHRFYVGRNVTATMMLLLTLSGFGILISLIWALTDFIHILKGSFRDSIHRVVKNWKKKI